MSGDEQQRLAAGLYVVATPIGNLGDLAPRALRVLHAATLIAAEDTRTARKLLDLVAARAGEAVNVLEPGAPPPRLAGTEEGSTVGEGARFVSLTEHNVEQRAPGIVAVARDSPVALVSDAGTPGIADPGARLVAAAHSAGVPVFAVPGPSALVAAVSVAGFEGSDVHFLGFLPKKQGERRRRLEDAARAATVLVCFESPARVADTLRDIAAALNDPEMVACRELTKLHEETVRDRASALAVRFARPRGEFVLVIRSPGPTAGDERDVARYLEEMARAGARQSRAAAEAARRFGITRQQAYALWPPGSPLE